MDKKQWWKESVVYQIYPQSFYDTGASGRGNLRGITEKLPYIAQLGVGIIWICPIYKSPGYDNGYDISDYEAIDPRYGTMADFECLLQTAHALGLRVIIDLVVNHTSSEHPWFQAACKHPRGHQRDYYIWRDGAPGGGPPNNWGALFGGPAWTRDEGTGQYYLHLFSPYQPDLNWENPKLRSEIYAVMRAWLAKGVDGFRMDVITLIAKPDDFSNGQPGQSGYFDPRARIAANPRLHEHLQEMRATALAGYDVMTVGEASATTLAEAQKLTAQTRGELDMVFQFEHMDLDGGETFKWTDRGIPVRELKQVMSKWQTGLARSGWNALFWNNHDQPRMLSRLGDEGEYREAAAKMLAVCLLLQKGTPFLFQGDELGMTNMRFTSPAQLRDSESINAYRRYTESGEITKEDMLRFISLKSRDNARTPMQWSANSNAGFTTGTPWMPVNPNYTAINAEEQLAREDSVLNFYKKLIRLRQSIPAAVYGEFEAYAPNDPLVFAYTRKLRQETLLVVCSFSKTPLTFLPPPAFRGGRADVLLANQPASTYPADFRLAPFEAVVLFQKEE